MPRHEPPEPRTETPTPSTEGQRDKAERIACSAPPGTLGRDAICPNFHKSYVRMVRNACAGKVGDFYELHQSQLREPSTDENIEAWAKRETEFFKTEGGCTSLLASIFTEEDRSDLMKKARDGR